MMETPEQNRNVFAVKKFLSEYLDLRKDKDNELETVDSIRKGVEFKGANLWILIFAIFMASLGLNVNSTAVIIGAMLISPLMGPIMGVGLSVGLNDFELMKRSLKSFLITTLFRCSCPVYQGERKRNSWCCHCHCFDAAALYGRLRAGNGESGLFPWSILSLLH